MAQLVGRIERGLWQPNLQRLEAIQSVDDMAQQDYAEAWAWTHFLFESDSRQRQLMQQYLGQIHRGADPGPLSAQVRDGGPALIAHLLSLSRSG
jgi:hypothetical protein